MGRDGHSVQVRTERHHARPVRVREFTQDDAHIFCLPDQIADEIKGVLDLTEDILSTFGFKEFEVNLSTQPEKSVGGPEIWDKAEGALKDAGAEGLGLRG